MKKKFIILTLCFTLIFTSINYKKSYAFGGTISLPILATVSSLAVGVGIVINNDDDLYDLGRIFYNYIDNHNNLTWSTIQTVFASSVSLQPNKLVSVESEFLDIIKDFFDVTFNGNSDIKLIGNLPFYADVTRPYDFYNINSYSIEFGEDFSVGDFDFRWNMKSGNRLLFNTYLYDLPLSITSFLYECSDCYSNINHKIFTDGNNVYSVAGDCVNGHSFNPVKGSLLSTVSGSLSFPYNGGYTWDNVDSKKENGSVSLPVPGDLGQLVGQGSADFWNNTDDLVGSGDISLPNVDNPSIDFDDTVSFPNTNVDTNVPGVDSPSVPNEGIWATIKEFIIGLVVPSDTYWTDTWGGLYDNFTNSFPIVDMDGFNDLVTGEKKFPNIDINIMGVTGRVVNGDVINSIVEWLRPIVAGFMMLCLMLFNYRKIYKLIRNSEPFGGIAPGTSDFSTGISEYSKQDVIKAIDMAAEYRAWKERGGK